MSKSQKQTVLHFLSAKWAMNALKKRRLKVSLLDRVNDPNELRAVELVGFPLNEFSLLRRSFAEIFGIACFSEHWDIPKMWADYADQGRGICLGLEIHTQKLTKVQYVPTSKRVSVPAHLYERFSRAVNSQQLSPSLATAFHPYFIRVFTTTSVYNKVQRLG